MITREVLEGFFEDTRARWERGATRFNIDEVCRWSFFFVDPDPAKLEPVADYLQAKGYEIKGFLEPDEKDDEPVWFLRADRVEQHTVESLHVRTLELYATAAEFNVEDYDGMDVGAVDGP